MLKGKTFMFSFLMIRLLERGFTGSKYRYPLHIVYVVLLMKSEIMLKSEFISKVCD